jgi:hypothetical protein
MFKLCVTSLKSVSAIATGANHRYNKLHECVSRQP